MTDISDINSLAPSDTALMQKLGTFIKHNRVSQNKSQAQLAKEAGIVRSTLSLFENGENTSMLVFIQLLRALKLLHMLNAFQVTKEISPIELAKIEQGERVRAGRKESVNKRASKSDW